MRICQLCFFTDFVKKLKTVLRKLVSKDIIWFGNGTARGFDLLAAQTVLEMKQEYPQIRLILVLPCRDQTAKWYDKAEIALYNDILKQADKVICLLHGITGRREKVVRSPTDLSFAGFFPVDTEAAVPHGFTFAGFHIDGFDR